MIGIVLSKEILQRTTAVPSEEKVGENERGNGASEKTVLQRQSFHPGFCSELSRAIYGNEAILWSGFSPGIASVKFRLNPGADSVPCGHCNHQPSPRDSDTIQELHPNIWREDDTCSAFLCTFSARNEAYRWRSSFLPKSESKCLGCVRKHTVFVADKSSLAELPAFAIAVPRSWQ